MISLAEPEIAIEIRVGWWYSDGKRTSAGHWNAYLITSANEADQGIIRVGGIRTTGVPVPVHPWHVAEFICDMVMVAPSFDELMRMVEKQPEIPWNGELHTKTKPREAQT